MTIVDATSRKAEPVLRLQPTEDNFNGSAAGLVQLPHEVQLDEHGQAPQALALVPAPAPSVEELGYSSPADPEDAGAHRADFGGGSPGVEPPPNHLITVYSPKGGVGTTFVAANLSLLLATGGERTVCLVDLDLEFGDVAIMAGLAPRRTIADLVDLDLADPEVIDSVITSWRPGLDCVLTPVDPSSAEQITPGLVTGLLTALRSRYDYVVVDTPSHLSEHVLDALDLADRQVLVCTPDVPALKNIRLVLDTLELLGQDPNRRSVLLNRYDEDHGFGPVEVQAAIKHSLAGVVPRHPDVINSVDSGVPLAAGKLDHPVTAALGRFVAEVLIGAPIVAKRRSIRLRLPSRKRSE